jgi:predicted transcriptional regulator
VEGGKMAFEPTEKEKVLESLMSAHSQGQLTEVSLRLQGKPDEADKLKPGNTRLSGEIDNLIGKMMDEWLGDADRNMKALTAANAKLEAAVAEIKKQINVAQNVVKIIGLLDDAVAIAKKVAAGF